MIDSCCQMQKKGSFLGRNKESLAKIAELTKTSINPTGVRNSRNFVFQVISPDKDTNKQVSVVISVGDFFFLFRCFELDCKRMIQCESMYMILC